MSAEKLTPSNQEKLLPAHDSKEQSEKIKSSLEKKAGAIEEHSSKELKETRKTIESQALSKEEHRPGSGEKMSHQPSITKAEKTRTYKMTMSRMQNQLPGPSRAFSKFIHHPYIEKTSAVVGNTIARPSGILGAGIIGFVGITLVMYFARRNGFEISNSHSLITILFVGGWALGLLFELLLRTLQRVK